MIMNKKLLFAAMSLAALTACTDNDFESKNVANVAGEAGSVQFEVINNIDGGTRASMDGNSIVWSAADGDLFTLYHGGTLTGAPSPLSGFENATYKASEGEGGATLTTPSMIKAGRAIMVYPTDTMFVYDGSGDLAIQIPVILENIENKIPYVSDLLTIGGYAAYSETATAPAKPTAYTTAGKDRKYAIYMRPMASQLILKADYAGTDATIAALTTGDDPINPIALTSVDITDATTATPTSLTKEIKLSFDVPSTTAPIQGTNWATVANNVWSEVTSFGAVVNSVNKLTTKCINGTESAKFLILPAASIGTGGLTTGGIVVNTIYGKVDISTTGGYTTTELGDAWYRYQAPGTALTYGETETTTAGTGSDASKVRYTNTIQKGLAQVIDAFSANTTKKATSVVVNEPTGAVGTRYVKVLLSHLDMDGLHIMNDKHLYDAVRVWKEIGAGDVTVLLDGDATTGEFEISQKTIAKINEINAALAEETTPRKFYVTACNVTGEACSKIVITGGGAVKDMDFIVADVAAADVVLKAGETWEWAASTTAAKTLTLAPDATTATALSVSATGVSSIINKGTFVNSATATLAIYDNTAAGTTPANQMNIPFKNEGTWTVSGGDLNVQFDVTNVGTLTIASGAEYHQDIYGTTATATTFTNDAETLPERFVLNDPSIAATTKAAFVEKIGLVNNSGVFAVTGIGTVKGIINNYGLIEHLAESAKTYITTNAVDEASVGGFAATFNATAGSQNKIGRINLPYSNKDEENVSISNITTATPGFVSVTVSPAAGAPTTKKLDLSVVGDYVNYVIIKGGIEEISKLSTKIAYVEFDAGTEEVMWNDPKTSTATYEGLVVFSPVNVKRGTTVNVNKSVYLNNKMYVGGSTNIAKTDCSGFFGNTSDNYNTMYLTY